MSKRWVLKDSAFTLTYTSTGYGYDLVAFGPSNGVATIFPVEDTNRNHELAINIAIDNIITRLEGMKYARTRKTKKTYKKIN